jgi:hypothetical protein
LQIEGIPEQGAGNILDAVGPQDIDGDASEAGEIDGTDPDPAIVLA